MIITEHAKANMKSKTIFEYRQEGKTIMKDEVQEAMFAKYENGRSYQIQELQS